MSEDAANELQGVIVATLKGYSPFVTIAGTGVYDKVQPAPTFPYVSIGSTQEVPQPADCIDASEYYIEINCWSRAVGRQEANRLANAIVDALDDESLSLDDNAIVLLRTAGRRTLLDKDGLTWRVILTFVAIVEKP